MQPDEKCPRCGSPRKILKTWTEQLETFNGSSALEMTQIVCTNEECQRLFDENRAKEIEKKNMLKQKKEEQDKIRKDNITATVARRREEKLKNLEDMKNAA